MKMESDIQVSVCVVAYNQEDYIAECLDSLVAQQTNFKFEVIVGEDCSTDNTRAIVQSYVEKYPEIVVPLFYENNIGPIENIKRVYGAAQGKYIAHMDGDDLALQGKLQKQFDIMEKGFAICSHNVSSINKNIVDADFWQYKEGSYDWKFYLKNLPFFAHSSKMFLKKHLQDYFHIIDSGTYDFELHLESIKHGSIYHLGENLGIYRLNVGILTNDINIKFKIMNTKVRVFNRAMEYFDELYFIKIVYFIALLKMIRLCIIYKGFGKIPYLLKQIFLIPFMR